MYRFLLALGFLSLFAGCAADLTVDEVQPNWTATNKSVTATISNIGLLNAANVRVYFNADESPISQNYRPQISVVIPQIAAGTSVAETVDFAPLARAENNHLGNVVGITVIADPKGEIEETDENNNTLSMGL